MSLFQIVFVRTEISYLLIMVNKSLVICVLKCMTKIYQIRQTENPGTKIIFKTFKNERKKSPTNIVVEFK